MKSKILIIMILVICIFSCKKSTIGNDDALNPAKIGGGKKHWIYCQILDGGGVPIGDGIKCTALNESNCFIQTGCDTIKKSATASISDFDVNEMAKDFADSWLERGVIDQQHHNELLNDCKKVLKGEYDFDKVK